MHQIYIPPCYNYLCMPHDSDLDRRTLLQYAGSATAAAATVSLAGCIGSDDGDDDNGDDDDDDTNGEDDEEFFVTVTQGEFPDTLDPVGDNSTPTYNVIDQAYEPFVYRDSGRDDLDAMGRPIARVVDDWERIDDQTIELTVRDGVTFHSGNECTAEDVAFSINRANGNFDVTSEVAAVIGAIDEAEALDDRTVEVRLDAVVPVIFRNLGAFGRVTEQAWIEDPDTDPTSEINGTGPFEMVDYEEGSHVDYEVFDDYWGDEPAVDGGRVDSRGEEGPRVDALEAGESDVITGVSPDRVPNVELNDDLRVESVPSIRTIFFVMNDFYEPFDDVDFRRAMNYAVDVDAIISSILEDLAEPTSQPTLEGHTGHNPDVDPYPYDPDQAEQLIEDSGYAGESITLVTPQGRYLGDTDIAEAAAGQIDELDNVSCEHEIREFGDLVGQIFAPDQDAAPPFFLIGWGVPTLDADYAMRDWFAPEGVSRMFNDEEIQTLLDEANNTVDDAERESLLQQANARARDQASWVFMHQQFSVYGVSEEVAWDPRQDEDILLEEMGPAE